jgi:UDP-N-acetyl-2-amino-2-deoxyglucuronate dehydrogenase
MKEKKLRSAVLGCRMGSAHAHSMASCEEYELVAVCDINSETASACAKNLGAEVYTDYATMLAEVKPDVVAVATPTNLHPEQTLQALEAGAKGICSEKPMAVCMGDARMMVDRCKSAGVPLVINHQRRLSTELTYARRLIEEGAIGEIRMVRCECGGDMLSDATHLLDSIMWLMGDVGAEWVMGQVHRIGTPFRYGHNIENGAIGIMRLKNGVRAEIMVGDLRTEQLDYQDYQVIGSKGILWRCGDNSADNLFISDAQGGGYTPGTADRGIYKPIPVAEGEHGQWRMVELPSRVNSIAESYKLLASSIWNGTPHPMSGEIALIGFEILMAVFESARLRKKIILPLDQDRYPLDMMIEQGVM